MSIVNRKVGILVALVVATSSLSVLYPSGARGASNDCPTIAPVSDIHDGMTGYGLTVSKGTQPEMFHVDFLGVLKDGIAPGKDLIIVDTSSPSIDESGVWAGMSGSPVYLDDGRLVGAISYSLSYGASSIAGLTPAEDMQKILQYTDKPEPGRHSGFYYYYGYARTSQPSATMRQRIARTTQRRPSTIGNFKLMKTPLSFSGLGAKSMAKLSSAIDRSHLPFIPYAGSSASLDPTAPGETPEPGDNFAAALSYGDITAAGVGTATFNCDGKTVAFGHPFFFSGPTTLGANNANAITIVSDPTFGSYKLANVTDTIGTVDQDRLSAIRADLGAVPPVIPITSDFTATDYGQSRQGETDALLPDILPDIAFFHFVENLAVVFDQEAGGSSAITWTIKGTREDGSPWELDRSDIFASEYGIPYVSFYELLGELYSIEYNRFEGVSFTGIDASGTVQKAINYYKIGRVEWSVDGSEFRTGKRVRVAPGDVVSLQVTLKDDDDSTADSVVPMTLQVPDKRVRSGSIQITGGTRSSRFLCFGGRGCGRENRPKSFDELLAQLQNAPHNNDLTAALLTGSRVKDQDVQTQDRVVSGRRTLIIEPKGSHSKGEVVGSAGSASFEK
ncbi:MAG: hypothetical protein M3290_02870 [Actinomycetota bacterium]|nr:hypothetical protein [Actinomycetota bacterium]